MKESYRELKSKLDDLIVILENPDIELDEALAKHKEAKKVISQIEKYLENAKVKVAKAKE